jgi:hypothetical protein
MFPDYEQSHNNIVQSNSTILRNPVSYHTPLFYRALWVYKERMLHNSVSNNTLESYVINQSNIIVQSFVSKNFILHNPVTNQTKY